MEKEWIVEGPKEHRVSIDHAYVSGRASIRIDGERIFSRDRHLWDTGFEYRFKLDGTPCIIRVICRGSHFTYELWVDGKLV